MNIDAVMSGLVKDRKQVTVYVSDGHVFTGPLDRIRIGDQEVYRVIWYPKPPRWFIFPHKSIAGIDHDRIYLISYTYTMFNGKVEK